MNKLLSIKNISVLTILILGFYLRAGGILTDSFAFTYDVGRDLLALYNIVYLYDIPLIGPTTGLQGLFYGPWWYYILSIPYLLSGGDPHGIVLFIALSGVGTALLLFLVGKRAGNFLLGFIFLFLASVSHNLVGVQAQIWNPNLAPFVLSCIVFLILKIDTKKLNIITQFLLGFLLGLSIELEVVYGLLLFLSTIFYLILRKRDLLMKKKAFFLLAGFLFVFIPKIIFEARHNFLMTKNILAILLGSSNPNSTFSFGFRIERIVDFIKLWSDTLAGSNIFIGIVFLFLSIAIFIYYRKKLNPVKDILIYSVVALLVFFVGFSVVLKDVWEHYLVGVPVFMILIFGISVWLLSEIKKIGKILMCIVFFLIFWFNVNPINFVHGLLLPPFEGDAAVYRNQVAVIDFIYRDANKKPFTYAVYTPPIKDYTYQYLFLWYGKNTYNYIPSKANEELFYLILEPDFQNKQRLDDWLKLREDDGTIISDTVIKGGIRVQKRIH